MPRSIRIYALYSDEDMGKIRAEIGRHRPQAPIVEVDGKGHLPEIAVSRGQGGDHLYGTVRVPTAAAADNGPALGHDTYAFYLVRAPPGDAIQGGRNAPCDILRAALGGMAEMSPYAYDKRRMISMSDAIRASGNAILYDPCFEFEVGDGYDGLSRSGIAVARNRCATTRPRYGEMLERASLFEPVLRVYQADGICDEASEMGRILKINRRFGFSMYVDVHLDKWIRFVKKYALPALRGGA